MYILYGTLPTPDGERLVLAAEAHEGATQLEVACYLHVTGQPEHWPGQRQAGQRSGRYTLFLLPLHARSGTLSLLLRTHRPGEEEREETRSEAMLHYTHFGSGEGLMTTSRGSGVATLPAPRQRLDVQAVGELSPGAALEILLLSSTWTGAHLMQSTPEGRRRLTGWEISGEEHTEGVPGHPAMLQAAQVVMASPGAPLRSGYLVWGGNAGVHAGGASGSLYPYLLLDTLSALPKRVQRLLAPPSAAGEG